MAQKQNLDGEVSPTPAEHPLTTTRKIHVLVAEIRRCLDTDKMLAAYRKLDAIDDLLAGVVPHRLQQEEIKNDDDDQARGGKWGSAQADLPRRKNGDT